MLRRSQLYVPGNNEKMITKASALDADSVVLDLEDSVPETEKAEARGLVVRLARDLDWGSRELCVRVNQVGTPAFKSDMAAIRNLPKIQAVLVPKVERRVPSLVATTGKSVIPIIETAAGLMRVGEIAKSKGAVALTFGAADYAASVGGSVSAYLNNVGIKTTIVAAARSNGLEAVDNVFFDLEDMKGFRREAATARSLGFAGKQVIHPSQIPIANEVFSPTGEEIEWAERVVKQLEGASARKVGAIRVDGKLVDAVHYRLARDIIERASSSGHAHPRSSSESRV